MKKLFKVQSNIAKNRMYIAISGPISRVEMDQIYTDIRFGVADLCPGFQVITDLSQASYGYLDGIATFLKIARFLQEKNVGPIIRIIKEPRIISWQLDRLTKMIEGYHPIYVSSLEEAEEMLNTPQLETV